FCCPERRGPRFVWLATKSAKIFQLHGIRAVPETNRGTRRSGRQTRSRPAFRLPKRDLKFAERSRTLSAIEEQRSARRFAKFRGRTENLPSKRASSGECCGPGSAWRKFRPGETQRCRGVN